MFFFVFKKKKWRMIFDDDLGTRCGFSYWRVIAPFYFIEGREGERKKGWA
jgi:hypothetical protein